MQNHRSPGQAESTPRALLHDAVVMGVGRMRKAKAAGDEQRAAAWAAFVNITTDLIIDDARRERLP